MLLRLAPLRRRALVQIAPRTEVEMLGRSRLRVAVGEVAGVALDALHDAGGERLEPVLARQGDDLVDALADRREVRCDVVDAPEVGQRERPRGPALDHAERAIPRLDVDVGRRRRRHHVARRRDPDAGDVADERGAGRLVQVAHVMPGVARRVLDAEVVEHGLAAAQHVHVRLRHRHHLAPQPREPLLAAVEPRGAGDEPLRRGHVRRPALVHVDGHVGPAPHQRAGRAGMVEVDVGEQDRARPLVAERLQQRLLRRLRARVDEHPFDVPAADDLLVAQVPGVDRAHGAESYPMRDNPHMNHRLPGRDKPWMMRTYAGHSTAARSNALYRGNIAKGQTGLSIAFDLPTQTGYDADHELARGEVGKVGVPVAHKGDMHTLLDGIPLDQMNTSMTINATAAWLLALYIVCAEENGIDAAVLQGTTQNDIIKEYLSRGTYAFPPAPSMRLIADTVAYTVDHVPRWNPVNISSYHLQEAGATPVQEIAYAMSTAIAVLDEVRPRVPQDRMGAVFGRISFFVNAGVRFVEEHAKLRAMAEVWDELGRERYAVQDERHRRFRYGVQVNSLGLTESQPENNVQRIVLEALAVTLGRNARARAIQLPAWNEALGLPRPWDQQWSLRIQQILANETDVLEYPDIFEGSKVMDGLVDELASGADAEMKEVAEHGGAVEAVPYMKARLVESNRERIAKIERGEIVVVGQNKLTETEDSPLTTGEDGGILTRDPEVERERIAALEEWRSQRDQTAVAAALEKLAKAARHEGTNILPATLEAARAGATTGEWAGVLREVFGDYRAPTGVSEAGGAAVNGDLLGEV